MTEYMVMFYTKISAKSKDDLERKAEKVSETLSKSLRKKVYPHGYYEVEKSDRIVQTKLQ